MVLGRQKPHSRPLSGQARALGIPSNDARALGHQWARHRGVCSIFSILKPSIQAPLWAQPKPDPSENLALGRPAAQSRALTRHCCASGMYPGGGTASALDSAATWMACTHSGAEKMLCFCEAILGTQPLTLSFYCFSVAKNRIRALSAVDRAHWVYHREKTNKKLLLL